jgi:hypothetical protein
MKYKFSKKMKRVVESCSLVDIRQECLEFFGTENINEACLIRSFKLDDTNLVFKIKKLNDIIDDIKRMAASSKNDVFEESGHVAFEKALSLANKISKESLKLYKEASKEMVV